MIRNSTARVSSTRKLVRAILLLVSAAFAAATASAAETAADGAAPKTAEQRQIDALQQQLQAVQAQMKQLAEQNQALLQRLQQDETRQTQGQVAASPVQPASSGGLNPPAAAPSGSMAPPSGMAPPAGVPNPSPTPMSASANGTANGSPIGGNSAFSNVRLWGYGEIYYTRPSSEPKMAEADLARAVFGIGYSFDARTEFNSEFEVEHAVSSASDVGEFEVEQFYVDRQLSDAVTVRGGLFLMPFGMLNEHHEPTNFFGVQRNFVETLIIPSTWREGGFNLHGDTPIGISWNAGLTTGFDLSKWNYAPEFPQYTTALDMEDNDVAPLQATHQELALANAHNLSQYIALGYYGVPGLTLGAAIFTGDAVKVPAPPNAPIFGNQRVTLWESHARWTPGKFDLSALYAHGSISNLTVANASNPGSPNPIPSDFYGYFAQAAYGLWERGDYRLAPFVRWETYNMGSSYAGTSGPVVPTGLLPLSATPGDYGYWPQNHDRVWTVGANFYTTPHVVLKADYQWFHVNSDFSRFDLGLGLSF
jgi:hypothetical protein